MGLLATRVELAGSSWCCVLSFARAPIRSYKQEGKTKETIAHFVLALFDFLYVDFEYELKMQPFI